MTTLSAEEDDVARLDGVVQTLATLGEVTGRWFQRRRGVEFIKFLDDVVARYPGKEIHVIADNLTTHSAPDVEKWLKKHSLVKMHYTPKGSSWLNRCSTQPEHEVKDSIV